MACYYVCGRSLLGINANVPIGALWNPAAGRRIKVVEAAWGIFGDTNAVVERYVLQRTSTRGSGPDNTVTPDADNSSAADASPDSAAVLDMGPFTTAPTLVADPLYCPLIHPTAATVASQPYFTLPFPRGVWVAPGTGLCVVQPVGELMVNNEVTFVFED